MACKERKLAKEARKQKMECMQGKVELILRR